MRIFATIFSSGQSTPADHAIRVRPGAPRAAILPAIAALLCAGCGPASSGTSEVETDAALTSQHEELELFAQPRRRLPRCSQVPDTADAGVPTPVPAGALRTVVEANAMTGFNDLCGAPIYRLPLPWLQTRHIPMVAEYDSTPGASVAKPLSAAQCAPGGRTGVVLATTADPVFQTSYGLPPPYPSLLNVMLNDVLTAGDGGRLQKLPAFGTVPANPEPPTRVATDGVIDLATWLSARGRMQVVCNHDGSAQISAQFASLLPNSLYSAVGVWTPPPGGNRHIAVPFGGLPNVFSSDGEGNARFERALSTCPVGATPELSDLAFIDIYYQANRSSDQAFMTSLLLDDGSTVQTSAPSGVTNMVQLSFPLGVECQFD